MVTNKNLMIWGIVLVVLSLILGLALNVSLGPLYFVLYWAGFGMILYGLLGSSKIASWLKWVITIVGGFILTYLLIVLGIVASFGAGVY